jgi:hypothetical protein
MGEGMIDTGVVKGEHEEDMVVFVRLKADETIAFKHGLLKRRDDGSKRRVFYLIQTT